MLQTANEWYYMLLCIVYVYGMHIYIIVDIVIVDDTDG
jgi:hypothetical protein